jgi:4-amino-4-deoxy-L-arabinose transferase-like glycosyltransferase
MELPRSSPARLTTTATIKLPRIALFLMCLVYAVPGLLGRDPWKPDDASSFGAMWTMANGHLADWLMPNVAGAPSLDAGPLMDWLGAISIRVGRAIPLLPHDDALTARFATLIMVLIAATGLWYATYLLGRRPAAQPLALAFGGHPEPRDYGRTLAYGALLILLGTLGLATRAHESSPDIAALAMLCACLYALARGLDQPRVAAIWMGASLAGLALTRGPFPAAEVLLVYAGLVLWHPDWRRNRVPALVIALPLALLLTGLWPLALWTTDDPSGRPYLMAWLSGWGQFANGASLESLRRAGKTVLWFALPGWPIALWGIWSWRREWQSAHIVVPVVLLGAMTANFFLTPTTFNWVLLLLLPSIVMLAGFGLPTLKRGAANAVDWFSLLVYSLTALALWGSWFTRMTGFPAAWDASLQRQVPGLANDFHIGPLVGALLVTAAWIWLARWRIVTHPKMLWRSVVLASGGVTLIWTLVMTLWISEVNYSRTYRGVAFQLQSALDNSKSGANACVRTDGVGLPQRASFAYFSNVQFTPIDLGGQPIYNCPLLLRQDSAHSPESEPAAEKGHYWHLLWEGRRPSDRDERFKLYVDETGTAPKSRAAPRATR